jgi:hypothetical protein
MIDSVVQAFAMHAGVIHRMSHLIWTPDVKAHSMHEITPEPQNFAQTACQIIDRIFLDSLTCWTVRWGIQHTNTHHNTNKSQRSFILKIV